LGTIPLLAAGHRTPFPGALGSTRWTARREDQFRIEDAPGNDVIVGGNQVDTIDASAMTGAVTVDYTGDAAGAITDGTDTITFSEVEGHVLTNQDDSLDGTDDSLGFTVNAGGGNDEIVGGSGDDDLSGDAGNDTVRGGAGNDRVVGEDGDDLLYGDAGNDTLHSWGGNNTLYGGDDADYFRVGYVNETIYGGDGGADADTLSGALADDALTITFTGAEEGTHADAEGDGGEFSEDRVRRLASDDRVPPSPASTVIADVLAPP
jgi:hypothetical protein